MSQTDRPHEAAPPSTSDGGPGGPRDIRERLAQAEGLAAGDVVEMVCLDQLWRWRRGEFIPSEAYFGLHPVLRADRDEAFELAYAEFALREELGQSPTLDEFLWRFPQHAGRFRIQIAMDQAMQRSTVVDPKAERGRAHSAPAPEGADSWPTVEGFAIESEIGRGGMGVVYKARQVHLNRTVALKMILGGDRSPLTTARFRAEGEAIARLDHPNIVQIHGLGDQDGHPYFILEYLDGGSLASQLSGRGWAPRDAARLIEVLALGVQEAHRQGVVHRDLKPSNILMAADGTPKLADFGLAKMLDFDPGLTRTEVILGTPSYMAPEQAEGKPAEVGEAADIYALGAIFYELLTGRPPFRAATLLQTLEAVRSDEPVMPSRLQPGLPRDAETICLKCLEKAPAKRYPSAAALADDLKRFLARESIRARPSGPFERTARWCARNPAVAALSAACVAALAVGLAGVVWKWREAEAQRSKVVLAERATLVQLRSAIRAQLSAEAAHQVAVRTRNDSQRLSANLALNRALELARRGEMGPALLWMVESLRFAPDDDPGLATAIRRNLTAWSRRLHGLRQLYTHPESVTQLAVSPDGQSLLTGCHDGKARLWDLKTGALRSPPWECGSHVECVAFSPDGRSVVTGGVPAARLRDARTGVPFGRPLIHSERVFRAEYRRDGKRIVTTTVQGKSAFVWNAETGERAGPPLTTDHPDWRIFCATFSPDGQTVVTGMTNRNGLDKEAAVQRWDAGSGRPVGPPFLLPTTVLVVQFSPDGRRLLTSCVDGKCQVRDATTLEPVSPPLTHPKLVEPATFSPDGTTVLTGCSDGMVRLWDVASGRQLGEPLVHEAPIWGLAFVPGGKFAVTGCADKNAWLWELAPDLVGTRPKPDDDAATRHVVAVRYSPDRRLALTVDEEGLALLTGIADGRPAGPPLRVPASPKAVLAFSPDGRRIAIGTGAPGGPPAQVWDVRGRLLATLPAGRKVLTMAFSRDGNVLATLDLEHDLHLWDAETGRPSTRLSQHGMSFHDLAFSSDGKTLLAATAWGPTVYRWDLATGKEFPNTTPFAPGTTRVAVSPDSERFLTVASKTVRLLNVSNGQPIGKPMKPSNPPVDAAFSDDGSAVCTVDTVGGVRLWDARTGEHLGPSMDHPGPVAAADIGPDGKFLVTTGHDGTVQVWDLATSRPIGPPLRSASPALNASLQPDGRTVAVTTQDGTTRLVPLPRPTAVDQQTLTLHFEVRTGRRLDGDQILNGLTPDVWRVLNARLLEEATGDR